jgi:hypothetical protein
VDGYGDVSLTLAKRHAALAQLLLEAVTVGEGYRKLEICHLISQVQRGCSHGGRTRARSSSALIAYLGVLIPMRPT